MSFSAYSTGGSTVSRTVGPITATAVTERVVPPVTANADSAVSVAARASSSVRVRTAPSAVAPSVEASAGFRVSTRKPSLSPMFALPDVSSAAPAGTVTVTSPSKSASGVTLSR